MVKVFAKLNEEQRAQVRLKHIGFVFQSFQLLPHLTAVENVMLPLRLHASFNFAEAEQRALSLLQKVGLERQATQTPKVLSGGEQQRVAIARALIAEPKIIFADEPTGNLDSQTAREIEQLLFQLNRELGTTLILVTHDHTLAEQCQRHFRITRWSVDRTSSNGRMKMNSLFQPLLKQSFKSSGVYLLIIALILAISATTALKFSNEQIQNAVALQAAEMLAGDLVSNGQPKARSEMESASDSS